ncbi:MAG TPA: amidohydrolase family protein [Phycisphaerae bacterium]|nr:amidohydrolase family protein [Phycisphaerae bacterium]
MSRQTHRARWIIPVDSPPIENGRLIIEAGRIIEIGHARGASVGEIDHGDSVIVPGFVNAHTHLELTPFRGRVPFSGSFVQWVEGLVAARRAESADGDPAAAICDGARQSLAAGVTAIGDIGCGAYAATGWSQVELWLTGCLEVLGMGPRSSVSHGQSFDSLQVVCDRAPRTGRCRIGLSPHAPYSVDAGVYQRAIECARSAGLPICTHLAETRDEIQFLADGTGPFHELLERWGLWDGSFSPPGCSPVQYMHRLGLLECRPLLIHVNYLDDKDMEVLSGHACGVAYCPRSHRFFDHKPHRWRDMLERGINVCVGTDSLASNDSLSVLEELRFLHRQSPATNPETLLRMGTLGGARALGVETTCGSLSPGKSADFVTIPLKQPVGIHPFVDVLESFAPPSAVYLRGARVQPRPEA